jgi:hypothetical protein
MTELESVKEEFERLDSADKRWIVVCVLIALAAIVTGVVAGSILGDAIAFVVTMFAGAAVHSQWQTISRKRRPRAASASTTGKPRQHRATARRRAPAKK